MGRNIKGGIPYFPVEVMEDKKMQLLIAKYGFAGCGLLDALRKLIYAEGYFIDWDEETRLLFASKYNSNLDFVDEVVAYLLKIGHFSQQLFEQFSVLTSAGIQRRYFDAIWKRVEVTCFTELMLIEVQKPDWSKTDIRQISFGYQKSDFRQISDIGNRVSEPGKISEMENQASENGDIFSDIGNAVSDVRNQQSRVEESKVKESRVNLKKDYMHTEPAAPAPENSSTLPVDDGFGELDEEIQDSSIPKRMASIDGVMMSQYRRHLNREEIELVNQLMQSHTAQRICRELTDQKARAPTKPIHYIREILAKQNPTKRTKRPAMTEFDDDEEVVF